MISNEAKDLYFSSDVIDLHVDSFIWNRLFGYDMTIRHGSGPLGKNFFYHLDLPRAREAGLTGAMWSISTNPIWPAKIRAAALRSNLLKLSGIFSQVQNDFEIVSNVDQYREARKQGKHGALISIQGGNALAGDFSILDEEAASVITRVTLIHLLSSTFGGTSTPYLFRMMQGGLTPLGQSFVKKLNEKRIFVDLAHASRQTFFDVARVHDPQLPMIVTHTGVCGVHDHWRNLTDEQIRIIAKSDGVMGIMFQRTFLDEDPLKQNIARVVDHMEYIIDLVGENFVAIGSDFDGAISPPVGLESCMDLPKVVDEMLARRWNAERIQKILGGNFLRSWQKLRA